MHGVVLCLVALYGFRGLLRPLTKSFISFILFPITVMAYVILPIYLGYKVFLLGNILGLIKLLFISFFIVTLVRWAVYFVLGKVLCPSCACGRVKQFLMRLPGVFLSAGEGFLLCICCFWALEYFSPLFSKQLPAVYEQMNRFPFYSSIESANPIYDIQGSKSLKTVLSVFGDPDLVSKMADTSVYRKFDHLPVIQKMISDSGYQKVLKEGDKKALLTHELTYSFLKDEDLFMLITSQPFIEGCRSVLGKEVLKQLDGKSGIFSDMSLSFRGDSIYRTQSNEKAFQFIPDTRIHLKSGFTMEGQLVTQDASGVLILMPEGQMHIKKEDILRIEQIS